jgi:hypothetical protein
MSNSSQPKNLDYNTKSIDDILKECTIDLSGTGASMNDITITSAPTFTFDSSNITLSTYAGAASTYTVGTSTDTITLTASSFTYNLPEEWVDTFPSWHRVQDMCDKYPGLKIAFDNFKVFYEMVKDDYDNPTPKK